MKFEKKNRNLDYSIRLIIKNESRNRKMKSSEVTWPVDFTILRFEILTHSLYATIAANQNRIENSWQDY